MKGKTQVEQYAKLVNSDQKAPASSDWQPNQIGGIRVGDAVRLPNLDCTFQVVGIADPLLTLRAPSGREVRAGWQAVQKIPNQRSK